MATTLGASKPGTLPSKPQKTSFFRDTKPETKFKKYEKKNTEEKVTAKADSSEE